MIVSAIGLYIMAADALAPYVARTSAAMIQFMVLLLTLRRSNLSRRRTWTAVPT